jgi:hypothetical protein
MKKKVSHLLVAATVVLGLCTLSAQANTVSIEDYGIGTIVPGTPADPNTELGFVQTAVSVWNGNTAAGTYNGNTFALLNGGMVPTPLTAPTIAPANDFNFNGTGNSAVISLGTGGYDYLLTRWGGGDILYYVGGLSGDITVENDLIAPGSSLTGLSHFALFGDENNPNPPGNPNPPSVPDGGSTLALLGPVLLAFGYLGRKAPRTARA